MQTMIPCPIYICTGLGSMSVMADKNAATVTLPGGYSVEVSPATGNYEVKISKSGDVSRKFAMRSWKNFSSSEV